MDLSDALSDEPVDGKKLEGPCPTNPTWAGQPGVNPSWPGGQPGANPTWPGGQPGANPIWPGGQPGAYPAWPGGQPGANPTWPGGQPGANPTWPTWPGGQPGANPTWPEGQPGANPTGPRGLFEGQGMWHGGNPVQPIGPCPFPNPTEPGICPDPSRGPGPNIPTVTQHNLAIPYEVALPYGVFDKMLITITGTIKPNADKITVDFSTTRDVAFHFNPRFNEFGRAVIVRNSCIGQNWGKEERDLSHFPFIRGQPFEIKILCTNQVFKVAVNKGHLLEFKHRITNLRSINRVSIYNDLNLSAVQMETMP
ncbi:galectin-3b isoform X2 [Melanotaenia boesemani]|nr:galectin-3b isoform X2 [Melanotaenia boesemani]XP_041827773.1 galectin-3b isoform X2 [Melanotaenia boesemani]XP_041827774.1 galectin-3b isoform X2 [Melanotaenia boesemani]